MKQMLLAVVFVSAALASHAQEKIVIANAQGPTQSMTAQFMRVVEEANRTQNKYNFVFEFKPGGFESIAVRSMSQHPNNTLATITNSVFEAIDRKLIKESDMVPVFSFGDSCWTVVSTLSTDTAGINGIKLQGADEITGGGPAPGGAAHITALIAGDKAGVPVRYILFRSNLDALTTMVADRGTTVNFVLERANNYAQLKERLPAMNALAMSCPIRHSLLPNVKTLKEQNVDAPYIWNFLIADPRMEVTRRSEIEQIFIAATRSVGKEEIFRLSDMVSPIFSGVKTVDHYRTSVDHLKRARAKWAAEIKSN
jgi:tripartite-type tricarboxylate transporter receptor subunit TctC